MNYLSQEAVLRNILLQLSEVEISRLCSQLLNSCNNILGDQSFWREKLQDQGINPENISSSIGDYKLAYQLISAHPDKNKLLIESVKNRRHDLYKIIAETVEGNDLCDALKVSIADKSFDITEYLLQFGTECSDDLIFDAAKTGNVQIVDLLLQRSMPSILAMKSFLYLGGKRRNSPFPTPHVEFHKPVPNFRKIFLKMLRKAATLATDPVLLYYAILTGDPEIIMALLPHPSIAIDNSLIIRLAAEDRLIDILIFTLNDSRVDPSALNNQALCRASHHGYLDVVKLLLTCQKVRQNHHGLIKAYQIAELQSHDDVKHFLSSYTNQF